MLGFLIFIVSVFYLGIGLVIAFLLTDGSICFGVWKRIKLWLFRISLVFLWFPYFLVLIGASLRDNDKKNLEEEIVRKNYDAFQCTRRRWNEAEKRWERGFSSCSICSGMCPQRAEDFERLGKKEYQDKKTGLTYWK